MTTEWHCVGEKRGCHRPDRLYHEVRSGSGQQGLDRALVIERLLEVFFSKGVYNFS